MLLFYLEMINTQEDKDKFELLYETYRKRLFYVANQIIKDSFLAEDAVHHTFLTVLEKFDKIDEVHSHKTFSFLVVIVRNYSINLYNKRKRHPLIPLDENTYADDNDLLAATEEADAVTRAIFMLPDLSRDILTLKYVHEFTNREIAAMLGITEVTVRKRLERAKKLLKKILKGEASARAK